MAQTPALIRRFVAKDLEPSDWAQVQPLFETLLERKLDDIKALCAWLDDYSELMSVLREHGARVNINKACDTESDDIDAAFMHWVEQIQPKLKPVMSQLQKKLLASKHTAELPAKRFEVLLRDWQADVDLFCEANVPIQTKLTKLASKYDKHMGRLAVQWQGRELTLQQLAKVQEDPDRSAREQAWMLDAEQRLSIRDKVDTIYSKQVALRQEMANNAGKSDYIAWEWHNKHRFDYTAQDCAAFCDAIAQVCVPMVRRLNQKRQAALGVDTLRPWDTTVDAQNRAALAPFDTDDASGLIDGCRAIFQTLNPSLAEDFSTLKTGRNLDLVSRKGKRGGGFQASLTESRQPFIFMNAAGRQADVRVMLHEAGHAFHYMWASATDPLVFLQHAPIEFCEVASMAMELFGAPHFDHFYAGDQAASRRAQTDHLEGIIRFFPWMAAIDRFQHWVYANPTHSADQRTAAWNNITDTYGTRHGGAGVDWSGLEDQRDAYWQRQIHLLHYPFYYVEYGIAQLGALQLWQRYRKDRDTALAGYRRALALGGTRKLPKLFEAADIRFDFTRATLEPLMQEIEREMNRLNA